MKEYVENGKERVFFYGEERGIFSKKGLYADCCISIMEGYVKVADQVYKLIAQYLVCL